ncbi:MAG: hypoxanthine phosphoribosyltransferase [Elusimicrobiota bacterium]
MSVTASRHPRIERVLFEADAIHKRVCELGRRITEDYSGRRPVLIAILKGSVIFLADLIREIRLDCPVDFIGMSSYAGDVVPTGVVRIVLDLRESVEGKDVLVIEDIVDRGLTISYLRENLLTRGPRSIEVCSLLDKPDCRKVPIQPKYRGFVIPDLFVIGYGLDYEELYRNLPYIGVLKQDKGPADGARA